MEHQRAIEAAKLKRGRFIWYSRIPFIAAVALGGVGMYLMKTSGYTQVMVTAFACSMIVLYAMLVAATPVLRLREDQLADNCYYLGFLFTLGSLSWALYEFALTNSIETIVGNFGIALGSTILGVVLRVFINQARRDVLETERDARIEMAQAVVRLRAEIDDAVLALGSFCRSARQAAEEQIRATAEESNKALEAGVTRVGEASAQVLTRIDEAFAEFRNHASQLNESSAATVKAVKSLLNRIEKIDAPADLVSRRLEPALQAIDQASDQLSERLRADFNTLAAFSEQSGELIQAMKEASREAAFVGEVSARTAQEAQALSQRMSSVSTASEAMSGEQGRVLIQLKAHNDALVEELERSRRVVSEMTGTLVDLADSIVERLK